MAPNPGSREAQALGCRCPVIDNGYGRGRGDGQFYVNDECPLHGSGKHRLSDRVAPKKEML